MAETCKKTQKSKFNLRRLRLSLKYRPDIMKLILKMRQCIRKKNSMLIKLKHTLKEMDRKHISNTQKSDPKTTKQQSYDHIEQSNINSAIARVKVNSFNNIESPLKKNNKSTQTDTSQEEKNKVDKEKPVESIDKSKEDAAWTVNEDKEKSLAEQVKEAAQDALKESGMVYVESAGMYYDYKTGYYYNSELGLYYHTDTGCYYYYSDEKKSFVFHSYPDRSASAANASLIAHEKRKAKKHKMERKTEEDIDNLTKNLSQDNEEGHEKPKKIKRKKAPKKTEKDENVEEDIKEKTEENSDLFKLEDKDEEGQTSDAENQELEDGECSDTGSEASDDEDKKSNVSTSTATDDESVAKHHPPCMRVIVRETSLPKLKVGSLFIVTKDGGTVGREGDHHTILLRDHNVSRNHMEIKYDFTRRVYMATDLGSKNGSVLNGSRMSASQLSSAPMEIVHGSTLQLGETKLLCHIHSGNDTCGHCEPGLLMETIEKEKKVAYTRTCSVQKQHQLELARLKNKYAPKPLAIEETAYNDRAQQRREAVGSSHHSEKTQSTDVDTFIAPENKGFKLLEKMGWSKGEGLGKDSQGDTEPVPLISNDGTKGLGAAPTPSNPQVSKTLGPATMRLASKTKMLRPPAKAFQQPLDEDSDN